MEGRRVMLVYLGMLEKSAGSMFVHVLISGYVPVHSDGCRVFLLSYISFCLWVRWFGFSRRVGHQAICF